ncbi:MAG: acyltransferase [Lachnospiraceae bacterium]|nr:acyltransferase [Lachnospiraceae bacterium]
MKNHKRAEREFGADVVRCVATAFIIGVHFFLHNGFYQQPQQGIAMFGADFLRWLTYSCVPLFLILTGYLKSECRVSLKYYRGILPILLTFLLMSGICIGFKTGYRHIQKSVWEWIVDIFNYKAADYAWYIELYIGLFLLCPFLNAGFHARSEGWYHKVLAGTMICIAFIPSLFNGMVIRGVEFNPIPDYFVSLWPFAYYVLGCYIRSYQPKLPKSLCLLLICSVCLLKTMLTFCMAEGQDFSHGIGGGYSDFWVGAITVLVFLFCYNLETKQPVLRRLVAHISKRSLHIYLISAVFDVLLKDMGIDFTLPQSYWWTFPLKCSLVFIGSLLVSEVTYPVTVWVTQVFGNFVFKMKNLSQN